MKAQLVFQGGIGGQDGVVRLLYSCGHLWGWVDGEFQLELLAIINRKPLHQQSGEARASVHSKAVEYYKALKSCAWIRQLADLVQHWVNNLLTNGVVTMGIVVGCIFFPSEKLLWVEEMAVWAILDLINYSRLLPHKDHPKHMFSNSSFTEGGEGVVPSTNGLISGHLPIRLNPMFQTVELPTGIAHLDVCLPHMV
jgi:hypothetical protein